jgi:hypothetical protein
MAALRAGVISAEQNSEPTGCTAHRADSCARPTEIRVGETHPLCPAPRSTSSWSVEIVVVYMPNRLSVLDVGEL